MRKTLLMPTIILLGVFLICFWISAGAVQSHDAIVFCQERQIHTIDPAKMTYVQDIQVAEGLWEGLLQFAPGTLKPIAGVARSWTISKNRLKYVFHLKRNARWSNGQRVTSRDFVFEWKRVLQPHTGAGYVFLYFHIAGAEKYFNSLSGHPHHHLPFSSVGIKAPSPQELIVTLNRPCSYFLDLMAFPPFFPLDRRVMEQYKAVTDGVTGYNPIWTRPPHLISNGAYKLLRWRFHQFLELVPNPYYDQRAQLKCRQLKVVSYEDATAAFLAYRSGVINVLGFIPNSLGPALVREARNGLRHDVHIRPVFGTAFLNLNCQRGVLKNRLVREALSLAINRHALVKNVLRMPDVPVHVLVPPNTIAGYHSPHGMGFDPRLARALLRRAGYPGGRGIPPLKYLTVAQAPVAARMAEAIGEMWRKQLGVHIVIDSEEGKIYQEDRVHGNFDVSGSGWYGDYPDPSTWLDLFLTGNPNNDSHFSSATYDAMLRRASLERNSHRRLALLSRAEALLVNKDFPVVPLYQLADGMIYNRASIAGIAPNFRMMTLLKYIRYR